MVAERDNLQNQPRDKLYEYAEHVLRAKLDPKAKSLLWLYAYVYNWSERRRSFWSEQQICTSVGMSRSTYQIKRKYLESLGWIDVIKVGTRAPLLVKPLVGSDDPEWEKWEWAKWHKSHKTKTPYELSQLTDEELRDYTEAQNDVSETEMTTEPIWSDIDLTEPIIDDIGFDGEEW